MTMPGWQPAPPPPQGKGKTRRTVLIVVGLVLVLCCGGVVTGGIFLFRGIAQATGPARGAADQFVTELQAGNMTAAYDLLCAETRSSFTPDAFTQGVNGQPRISSHEIREVNVVSRNGTHSATVTADLTLDTGFVDQHTFALVKEGDQWKVCGQPY